MDVTFSVNLYNGDGDKFDDCLLLHFGKEDTEYLIVRLDNIGELKQLIERLQKIESELAEYYEQ